MSRPSATPKVKWMTRIIINNSRSLQFLCGPLLIVRPLQPSFLFE
jgi:hypothetical protein